MQILNKYKKNNPILVLSKSNIWDFVIENDYTNIINPSYFKDHLIAHIEIGDFRCVGDNILASKIENVWSEAIYENATFSNIGFTGIDNGLVSFDIKNIDNKKFLEILSNSKLSFNDGRLTLFPLKSNTTTYSTNFEIIQGEESFVSLKGGGFQGFFKSADNKYQVLPSYINDCWTIQMKIRPKNYEIDEYSINKLHPENKGIIFYMGTKSENKFLNDYNYDFSEYDIRNNVNYDNCNDEKNEYFNDEYFLKEEKLDSSDIPINDLEEGYFEIETDNKYLFFNNTENGFNVDTWGENYDFVLTGISRPNINMYLLLNNTKTGYTVDTIDSYIKEYNKNKVNYNIKNDIVNNSFALKINDDGSIGYRYLVGDCENEMKILEEYSLPNVIKTDEWNNITIKIKVVSGIIDECNAESNDRKIIIYIYNNGYLKFVSKELPDFKFRALKEIESKQESVPFNISIGCGTMGLSDCISWDYNKPFKYILPLEKYFGGTFIGDISDFKFYDIELDNTLIKE